MNILIIVGYTLFIIYSFALGYVTLFCLLQIHLLYRYYQTKNLSFISPVLKIKDHDMPFITFQLPLYNEKYVAGRLIDNIMRIDYPKDKFEVQILDDSTDETNLITRAKATEYSKIGFNVECINRANRSGYKAGALKEGLKHARGEFIAIFDADFLPKSDFLLKTLDCFDDPKVGVVQTRWEHINQKDSLLTEMQAFQLNVHFTIEQKGRYNAGYLLQFNGTAGLWRKTCIEDAGGWEADTLTEDLDLSYRAQIKGWKIRYMEEVTSPSELPSEINGLKSQQFRWMKGGAETAKKILPGIWTSKLKLAQKIQATVHLLSSSIFIFVFILGIFSFPLLFFINPLGIETGKFTIFLISLFAIIIVYYVANVRVAWPKQHIVIMVLKFVVIFPIFLALSMGLAFHNSLAVIQGFAGKKSSFIRTPKYGTGKEGKLFKEASYFSNNLNWIVIGEGFFSLYFFIAVYYGWQHDMMEFILFHTMLAIGYLTLFLYAVSSKVSK
ncbi:MAG: glycosyltransferase [Saprospiraceae bacterium]|nr:glycosyltransferase [Saprospiraceae bacterium]